MEGSSNKQQGGSHSGRTDGVECLSAQPVNKPDGKEGKDKIDQPDERSLKQGVPDLQPGGHQDLRCIVHHRIDPGDLHKH